MKILSVDISKQDNLSYHSISRTQGQKSLLGTSLCNWTGNWPHLGCILLWFCPQ